MANDLQHEIEQVNEAHRFLQDRISALVRRAGGDRAIVYQTSVSDGGEVLLSPDTAVHFDGARLFRNRSLLTEYCARYLKEEADLGTGLIIEVGVETGNYSAFLFDTLLPETMALFDLGFERFLAKNERLGMYKVRGDSTKTISTLDDQSVSFAYIDGAHDFETVSRDIENVLPKMKSGGIIQFNDYATYNLRHAAPYGVKAAVNNLINSGRVSVAGYALCPLGFDDIALSVL